MDSYDVVVIGGGPAGYVAAIRCAQLGLETACVDDWSNDDGEPSLGGTCLNVGCIPSKALLDSSRRYFDLSHAYADHGIQAKKVEMDVSRMIQRKAGIVGKLTGGVAMLFKSNGVKGLHGHGKLKKGREVEIRPADRGDSYTVRGEHVILASGSVPIEIPGVEFDGEYIVDNAGALDFANVPGALGVIGAGVIGLELGSVWQRLGSDVVLLEALDDFLAACDRDIARLAEREFRKQGLDIRLGTRVTGAGVDKKSKKVKVSFENADGEQDIVVDRLLVAVGRRARTEDLLADGVEVELDDRGRIAVDEQCRTGMDRVWAIGDAVRGAMLAHKGSEEGVAVAERIAGQPGHVSYDSIPWVIYTEPEIAWAGSTEAELEDEGIEFRKGSFPFAANGRALAMNEPAGQVKILADATTDRVLGCHIIGANASELIAECVVAMEFGGSSEDLARIVHAHPTLSEAVHEAALGVHKRAIHRAN